jgi:hypothetical protein
MPTLVVIGADSSLRERLGAVSFSFELRYQREIPRERRLAEAALLAFPGDAPLVARFPLRYPLIAFGPVACMADALDRGVADYLAEPWCPEELRLRAERVLGAGPLVIKGTAVALRGLVLSGPGGSTILASDQASLLRQLIAAEGTVLSRGGLRRYLWPTLADRSRAVDITVSRLRRRLALVSGRDRSVQIRSVRGFGYSITVENSLWGTCE